MKNKFWLFVLIVSLLFLVFACTNDQITDEELMGVEEILDFRDEIVGNYKVIFKERQYLPPTDPSLPNPYPIDTIEIDKIIQVEKPVDYPLYNDGMKGRLLVDGELLYATLDSTGVVKVDGPAGSWDETFYGIISLPNLYLTWNDKWSGINYYYSGKKED